METNNEYGINDRVLLLMDTMRYKPVEFANAINLIPSNISNLKQKKSKPGLQLIQNILQNFKNVNPHWLILGEGEMFLDGREMDFEKMKQGFTLDDKPPEATGAHIPVGVYQDTRKDLEREQRLHESERERVDKLIDALTSRDTHSDKSLIDYMKGPVIYPGVMSEGDEPGEKKRVAR